MAEPSALHPLMLAAGSVALGGAVWLTAARLGSYVQLNPVHIRLRAQASLPIRYSVISGTLPGSLQLDPVSGVISGVMPALIADTVYSIVVTANTGTDSLRRFSLTGTVQVETEPVWQTPAGAIGSGNSDQIFIATLLALDPDGLPIGYRFANSTSLPSGLSFNVATGQILGILPPVSLDTSFSFIVNATNGFFLVPRSFAIIVLLEQTIYWHTPAGSLTTQLQNTVVLTVFNASSPDNAAVSYTLTDGFLPVGVTLDPPTGTLYGVLPFNTDIAGDTYNFTVTASNGVLSAARAFSITSLTTTAAVDPFGTALLLLLHCDGVNNSHDFIDSTGNEVVDLGHPLISSIQALFGGSSAAFDGASRLSVTPLASHDFDLSATDYTIEYALLFTTLPTAPVVQVQISNANLTIGYDGNGHLRLQTITNSVTTVSDMPFQPFAGVWCRIAVVAANSVTAVYVDGQAIGNAALSLDPGGTTTPALLGGTNSGQMLTGFLDEIRITRAARYLGNYVPQQTPFPDLPRWITTRLPPAIAQQPYLTPLLGTDPNGDGLLFSRANGSVLPLFLSTTEAGSLEGVAGFVANTTNFPFTLVLTDGFNPVAQDFSLQILDNPPPTLGAGDPIGLGTYVAGWPVAAQIVATSLRHVPLTYTAPTLASLTGGLQLDPATGAISGVAPPTPVSNSVVVFMANIAYGTQAVSANYAISFEHDFPPVWQRVTLLTQPNATVILVPADNSITTLYQGLEGDRLPPTTLLASDPNRSQSLVYTLAAAGSPLPADLALANGHITGTLANVAVNTVTQFSLVASDGHNNTVAGFAISVTHVAAPLWLTAPGALAAVVPGTPYTTLVEAVDTNSPLLPLTYALSQGSLLPPGLALDPVSGAFSGLQTGVAADTTFAFTLLADNGHKTTPQDFTLFVPLDHGVVWLSPAGEISNSITGDPIAVTLTAISLDTAVPVYTVTAGALPPPLLFIAVNGTFGADITGIGPPVPAGDPDQLQYTGFPLTVTATNSFTSRDQNVSLAIGDCLPAWVTDADLGTVWGAQLSISAIHATTSHSVPHPPSLRYALLSPPESLAPLTLDPVSGHLLGRFADVGSDAVSPFVANATDGINSIIRTFSLSILASTPPIWQTPPGALQSTLASNAIIWTTPADLGARPAETAYSIALVAATGHFTFTLLALDPQTLPLRFSTSDPLPGTLQLDPSGALSGTLTAADSGSFSVTVDDGIKTNSQNFSVSGDANINPLIFRLTVTNPTVTDFSYSAFSATLSGLLPPVTANVTSYTVTVEADNGLPAEVQTRVFTLDSLYPYPSWITPDGPILTALGDTMLSLSLSTAVHVTAFSPVGRSFSYTIDSRANLPPGITQGIGLPDNFTPMANAFTGILPEVLLDNTWTFLMNASDGHLPPITGHFAMVVKVNPNLVWDTPAGSIGNVFGGLSYSNQSILANSATGAVTYALVSGALPDGISFANATPAQGTPLTLSGVLANAETETIFSFVMAATTDAGFSIQRGFSIDVLINTLVVNNSDFIDPFCADVVLLMHYEGLDKAHVYYDDILHTVHALIQPGALHEPGPYLSTIRARCGLTSLYLDGRTGIFTADAPEFDLSVTDWTLEWSLYLLDIPAITGTLFSCTTCWITYGVSAGQQQIILHYTPLVDGITGKPTTAVFPAALLPSVWYSLALVRANGALQLFVNGSAAGQIDAMPMFATPMNLSVPYHFPVCLGCRATISQPGGFITALYLDEVRLTRAARYSAAYFISPYPFPTPPAFRAVAGHFATVLGGVQALLPLTATDPYQQGLQYLLGNGALPPPMNLLANGLIEGTPDNPSTDTNYTFSIALTDGINPVVRTYAILDKFNFAPVWQTVAGQLATTISGTEIAPLFVRATDKENYPLSYTIVSGGGIAPLGTVLNASTGAFTGVSTVSANTQDFVLTIAASDGVTPVNRTFSILSMGNQPPVWTTLPGQLAALQSGAYLNLKLLATDSNRQVITYRVISVTPATSFVINSKTGTLSGYQTVSNNVTFAFVIGAANPIGETPLSISIGVSPSASPVVANAVVFTGLGGLPAVATVIATDPQGLPLTYFMGNPALPAPLTIASTSGVISGVLPNPVGGHTYPFSVTVTNQALATRISDSFVITYNLQPVWQVGNNLGSFAGVIAIAITAHDPEGFPVTYSFEGGSPPAGTSFNTATGLLSGSLTAPSAGDVVANFSLGASDGVQKNIQSFTLTSQYSGVPLFQTAGQITAAYLNQGYGFSFVMKSNLITSTNFTLTGGGLPTGLTLNPNGTITGVPTVITGGQYGFSVTATNSAGQSGADFALPYLTLPKWTTASSTLATWFPSNPATGNVQSVTVVAASTSGFPISYTLASGALPPGCTLDPNSGTISGVVGYVAPGNISFLFTIAAQDSGFLNGVSRNFGIIIKGQVLSLTRLSDISSLSIFSGQPCNIVYAATDTAGFAMTITLDPGSAALPVGLSVVDQGGGRAAIVGTVDLGNVSGVYPATLLASDPFISKQLVVNITVIQLLTPVWNGVSDLSSSIAANGSFTVFFYGVEDGHLPWNHSTSPPQLATNVTTHSITSGALPAGLLFRGVDHSTQNDVFTDVVLQGTITAATRGQVFFFTVTAVNNNTFLQLSASQDFVIST